ncbi:uncharacterized protein LOC112690562 isoform X2 [Sipha flava]|uniref:Uncharacterized protein LOC112690562 isoform X2 n=1 Tax=Sipha flava TaxID=143950 RepID=A0A8B8GBS6_9HEMI|nr:uncharacterized protein LOC112690562 isoform X2 [Sipha flava]
MASNEVLNIFKQVHKARLMCFKNDNHMLTASKHQINEEFKKNKTISDPVTIQNGHSVKSIYNAKNRNNCILPVFFEDIHQQDNNNDIHEITSLFNTIVRIEKPLKKRRGPLHCLNCQDYGHTKNYCNHEARCVKCGENHLTIECTKDRNSLAKCALCAKDHTANFKGCSAFESIFKKSTQKFQPVKDPDPHFQQSQPRTKTKSNAEATNNQNKITEQISNTFSKLISNLSSLINPLISLLKSVLNTLIAKGIISP